MTPPNAPLWTIDELGAQVALALSVDYDGPDNGRVREIPDRRTIRYYTTLGLIDRPAEMRGRTAFYGRRHLSQIVAIKRLQARGLSLAQVQEQLVGQPDRALNRIARLPDLEALAPTVVPPESAPTPRAGPFWAEAPAAVPDQGAEPDETATEATAGVALQGVPLAEGAILLLELPRPLDPQDISAIRAGAAPLLKLLEARRLLRPRQKGETHE
jgi:DNA-binding transcriptional MerR regulator